MLENVAMIVGIIIFAGATLPALALKLITVVGNNSRLVELRITNIIIADVAYLPVLFLLLLRFLMLVVCQINFLTL